MVTLLPTLIERPKTLPKSNGSGPFEILGEIGRGGMATVVVARDKRRPRIAETVAVKRIHPHFADDPAFVAMFADEARVISQINHPNVCHVFDHGTVDGTPYLAMEHLVGAPLSRVHGVVAALSSAQRHERYAAIVATILADACEGLHAAHELRADDGALLEFVHRDVSLANIFLTSKGFAKIVDFGTVKSRMQHHQTPVGTMKGKFSYLQPERG